MDTSVSTPQAVATVISVEGQAFARTPAGQMRALKAGDVIREGETIVTLAGGQVQLAFVDGHILSVLPNETYHFSAETSASTRPSAAEASLAAGDIERVIQALERGENIDDVLDPTAAGVDGAGENSGNGFVRLLRIVEGVGSEELPFGTAFVGARALQEDPSAALADSTFNNTAAPGSTVVPPPVDTTPPVPTITLASNITPDDIVNAAEAGVTVNVTGTVGGDAQVGDTVTLTINGNAYIGTVAAGGIFSINVPGNDLISDSDLTVSASITTTDAVGNSGTATDTETYSVDLSAAASITVDPITADDVVNAAEAGGTVNVTGSVGGDAAPGDTVSFTVNGTPYSGTVGAGNAFSIAVAGADLAAQTSFDATVTGSDAAGNPFSATTTSTHTVDLSAAATITVDPITADDVVNAAEAGGTVNVTGSVGGDAAPGDTVSFTVNGTPYSGTVGAGNAFSIAVAGADLAAQTSFDATVTGSDAAGNPFSATTTSTHTVDLSAPTLSAQSFAYNENQAAGATVATLVASDNVAVTNFTFSATGTQSSADGYYQINNSGVIILTTAGAASSVNDYEQAGNSGVYSVTARDAAGNTTTANITLSELNLNDNAPTTSPVTLTPIAEDSGARLITQAQLLGNASDADGSSLAATGLVISSGSGTLVDNGNGTWSYTPALNDESSVSFSYSITDGAYTIPGSANLDITPVNDAPLAVNDSASVAEDATVTRTAITGVLGNDIDPDVGDTQTVISVAAGFTFGTVGSPLDGIYGTLTLNADGSYSYIANLPAAQALAQGQVASEDFEYTMRDASGATSTALLTFTVTGVNDLPTGTDNTFTTDEDTAYTFSAASFGYSDVEGSPLASVRIDSLPTAGTLLLSGVAVTAGQVIAAANLGNLTFAPAANANGTGYASFTFSVNDGTGFDATPNTITMNVTAINDAPVNTVPGAQSTNEDTAHVFSSVSGNAISVADVDGGTLTTTVSVTNGSLTAVAFAGATITNNGTAAVTISGTAEAITGALDGLSYINTADYNGSATLTVQTSDGSFTDSDTIAITVTPVVDIMEDATNTAEDNAVTINVLGNDSFENAGRTITAVNGSAITDGGAAIAVTNGSVTLVSGQLVFTPAANFNGTVPTFTYTITSGGVTETANVNVTVTAVNDAAVITGDSTSALTETNAVQSTGGTLTATDIDSSNAFVAQTGVAGSNGYGSFSIDAAGVWTYTMNSAHNEFVAGTDYTDSITVATADGTTQVITVTITGTNDAAVITGASTASLTETNAVQSTGGTLTATDVDSSNAFVAQTGVAGSNGYGSFSIDAAGVWTYTMNSAHNEFVAGTNYTDSITVATADGTTQVITVTITGTDDAPSFGTASRTANVSEEGLPNGVPDTTGTPADTTNALVSSGTFAIADIDGPALSVTLTAPSTALTSGGQPITWSGSGTSTLTASAGSNVVMTISITNTGAYTVTLSGTIDHATAGVEDIASLGITVTASDGILTTTGTLTVNIEDDALLASNDFATLTMGSNTAGNVSTNDLGAELPGTIESVVYQGTTYTPVGGVITVDTGKGILLMNQDGSYTYESSLFTTAGGSNGLADWSNVSITAFNGARTVASQNEFFIDPTTYVPLASNILSITGTGVLTVVDSTLPDGTDGLGIAGGSGSATYLNGHPSNPEALMVNLGNEVLSLNANFYSGTNSGVQFYWAAYDASGNLVGTGSNAVAKPGFTLDVDTGGTPFQYVAFYGVDTSASTKILLTGFDSIQYADTSPDEFTYNIVDADGDVSSAQLAISQTAPGNTAPVAADDSYTTIEDTALTLNVLGNDSDPDGDPLLLWGYTQATNGTVTTDAGGNLVYTPNANWSGTDTFTYTIRDSNGGIDTASVNVVVTPVADAPQLLTPAELNALVAGTSTANTTTGATQANLAAAIALPSSTLDSFDPPPGSSTNDPGTVDVFDGGLTNYTYALPAGMSVLFDWTFINGEDLAIEINDGYNDIVVLVVTNPDGTQTSTQITSAEQAGPSTNTSGTYTFLAPLSGGYQFSWLVLNARDGLKDSSLSLSNIAFQLGASTFGTPVEFPISTALIDTDGSETLSVSVAGVPAGAAFSAGTNLGGGIWTFTPAQLTGLIFLPADGYTGTINLTVTSTATESSNGSTATTTQTVAVTVAETTNTIIGTNGNNTLTGTVNNDHIQGLSGNDTLSGGVGNDLIFGGTGNDTLNGNDGNDRLSGGAGTDILNGGNGNDTLIGGMGNDTLTGGIGSDVFRWELADQGAAGTPAMDTITDFNIALPAAGGDILDLRDLLVGESHTGSLPGTLDDYLHFEISGTDTIVHISTSGGYSGGFNAALDDQQITLTGVDLVTGFANDNAIITDLLAKSKLITD